MKKAVCALSFILAVLLAAAGGYCAGRRSVKPVISTTFYAVIDEIREGGLLVTGMEVNDINSRGEFTVRINDDTSLVWRGVPITLDDLRVGAHISVTYTGLVLESYPAQIREVTEIKLLDDDM